MTTLKHRIGKLLLPWLPISEKSIRLIRFELNALITRLCVRFWPATKRKLKNINAGAPISLNLGSGGRGKPDWINIDIVRHHADQSVACDIRFGLPFKDMHAERIFAEHVLEHLEFGSEAPRLLADCYRVLKPGGWIRIIVPDGKRWLEAYVYGDNARWKDLGFAELPADMPTRMAMINHVFHQNGEHQFAYDFESMYHLLSNAGFTHITESCFGAAKDAENCLDRPEHAPYSLYIDAQKPLV